MLPKSFASFANLSLTTFTLLALSSISPFARAGALESSGREALPGDDTAIVKPPEAPWPMLRPEPLQAEQPIESERVGQAEAAGKTERAGGNSVTAAGVVEVDFAPVLMAQTPPGNLPPNLPPGLPTEVPPQTLPRDPISPDTAPLPEEPPQPLPPSDELLQPQPPAPATPELAPEETPQRVFVERFEVVGSTVFNADELAALAGQAAALSSNEDIPRLIRSYCPTPEDEAAIASEASQGMSATAPPEVAVPGELSFEQLLRARSAITRLYIKCGYITSGAILPEQTPDEQSNRITIQVVEGRLEEDGIEIIGLRRLNPNYVRSRLALAASTPLNQDELVQGLELLQLDPLIGRIEADLQTGTQPATNVLQVEVVEADTFDVEVELNNNRSPSVGSFQRGVTFTQANLLGLGDRLSVSYNNTDGSNGVEGSYTMPVNPRNGTVSLRGGYTSSRVVEPPFDELELTSDSFFYEVSYRQPIVLTPTQEFALGLAFSRQETQTRLGIKDIGRFPLSRGADDDGSTRISALRFTQEWFNRAPRRALAVRSQFSLGLDFLDSTINDDPLPDSRFFTWRGQGRWAQLLNDAEWLLLVRADAQLTGDDLLPLEQFGLGGQDTVRGYRQDELLTDNGVFGSIEVRIPVWEVSEWDATLSLTPFLDAGIGWNTDSSTNPEDTTLIGTGIGVHWAVGDRFSAELDWGIPLVAIDSRERTWQESGVYFTIRYSGF